MSSNQSVRTTEVISGDHVVNSTMVQPIPVGQGAAAPASTSVEAIRDGDLVRMLKVRCSCGQTIQIACEYEQEQ